MTKRKLRAAIVMRFADAHREVEGLKARRRELKALLKQSKRLRKAAFKVLLAEAASND